MSAPTKSLRETASSTGRPSATTAGSPRSAATVWAGVFPRSGPGSTSTCSAATPWARASSSFSARNAATSAATSRYAWSRTFRLGSPTVWVTTSAAPVAAHTSASAGSRRPLTSLTIAAPAAIAAWATSGL